MEDPSMTVIVDVGAYAVRFGTATSDIPTMICSPYMSKVSSLITCLRNL